MTTLTPVVLPLNPNEAAYVAAGRGDDILFTIAVPLSGGRTFAAYQNCWTAYDQELVASICTTTAVGTPVTLVPSDGNMQPSSNGPTAAVIGPDLILYAYPVADTGVYGTRVLIVDCSGSTPVVKADVWRPEDIDGRVCYSTTTNQAIYAWMQNTTVGGLTGGQTYLCVLTTTPTTISFGPATAWPESADSAASGGWNGTVGIFRARNYAYFFSVSAGAVVVGPGIGISGGYDATVSFGGHNYDLGNAYGPWCYWPSPTQPNVWYAIANWDYGASTTPWVNNILRFTGDGTTVTPTAAYQISGSGAYNSSDPVVPYNDASPVALVERSGRVDIVVTHQSVGPDGTYVEYHEDIFGSAPTVQGLVMPSDLTTRVTFPSGAVWYPAFYSLWAGYSDATTFSFVMSAMNTTDGYDEPYFVVIGPDVSGAMGPMKVYFG